MRVTLSFCAAVVSTALAAGPVRAEQEGAPQRHCFYSGDARGYTVTVDGSMMLLHVGTSRYFRIDFGHRCSGLRLADVYLLKAFNRTTVCSPQDWDVVIQDSVSGIRQSCFVSGMKELTPEEVNAIPPRARPF